MLELVENLKGLAIKKKVIENSIKGIDSQFFRSGTLHLDIETSCYQFDKDVSTGFKFDGELVLGYLRYELQRVEHQIAQNIKDLEVIMGE